MARVYEALRRAEEERKRRIVGDDDTPVSPILWDEDPSEAPVMKTPSFWRRWLSRLNPFGGRADLEHVGDANRRRISLLQPDSYVAEQFRTLRGQIDSVSSEKPVRTLAVTSANAGEGKSTAAINLALVMAMSVGRECLLVDCDLRRPKIQRSLGLEPQVGLAEVLLDEATLDEAVLKVEGLNLHVLAVRKQPTNPSELLGSGRMRELIAEISQRYDFTVLDTPATLGLPDAKIVSGLCDGLVMVVRADVTPRKDIEAALEMLDRRRVLGMILNGSKEMRERYGYY